MNASLTVVAADIILDAVAVGLFLFALVFFFFAYRSLADKTYLSIFLICAATMAYCGLGLLVFSSVLGGRDAALASILVRLQDLCLPLFFSFIPYFWSNFLHGRPRLAAALRKAAFAGLAASAAVWAIAFALPSLYIDGFRFSGDRLVYRLGPLYYAMQVPYLACLLGSLALLLLGRFRWRVLQAHWTFYVGLGSAVAFSCSTSFRTIFGFYLDPFFFARFSRLVAALMSFGFFVSYGFVKRFLADAGALRRTKESLDLLLATDALTGLPNRRSLLRDLEAGSEGGLAVLLVDLEGFNDLNASFGTPAGDAILKAVGPALRPILPPSALVYRIGGDDFVLTLPGRGDSGRAAALELARIVRARLKAGIRAEGTSHPLECSIALSIMPEDEDDPEALLSGAFGCLREAKLSGRAVKVFSREWRESSLRRIETVRLLKRDIDARRFRLAYQPIHDAAGGLSGAEALLRWESREEEMGPAEFVPLLESAGFMPEMGRLAIDILFGDLAAVPCGRRVPRISVNLSPAQLASDECAWEIVRRIEGSGLPFSAFQFEVTESLFLDNGGAALASLELLRGRGSLVAIDDFGSGYSNLGYLGRLPADKIKIDKSFIQRIPGDPSAESLARSLADIGRSFGLGLVAEGVETEPQLALLREAGYDEFQGYFFSRPLPRADFLEYAERAEARAGAGAGA